MHRGFAAATCLRDQVAGNTRQNVAEMNATLTAKQDSAKKILSKLGVISKPAALSVQRSTYLRPAGVLQSLPRNPGLRARHSDHILLAHESTPFARNAESLSKEPPAPIQPLS
jgi:hypothetical protein